MRIMLESQSKPLAKNGSPALVGVGTHYVFSVLIGGYLGHRLDLWLETKPVFMFVLGALGFVAGVLNMFRELKKWEAAKKEAESESSDG